jgi:hypothetical protein
MTYHSEGNKLYAGERAHGFDVPHTSPPAPWQPLQGGAPGRERRARARLVRECERAAFGVSPNRGMASRTDRADNGGMDTTPQVKGSAIMEMLTFEILPTDPPFGGQTSVRQASSPKRGTNDRSVVPLSGDLADITLLGDRHGARRPSMCPVCRDTDEPLRRGETPRPSGVCRVHYVREAR